MILYIVSYQFVASTLKLICKLLKNPRTSIRLSEAKRILEHEGAVYKRTTGSHYIYRYGNTLIVFQVHGKKLHPDGTKHIVERLRLWEKYADECE